MRFRCSRKDLLEGVQIAGRAVSSRSSLPILSHLLIRTQEDKIRLAATDLELGVECFACADVQEQGAMTVPAKVFSEILSTLPETALEIEADESNNVTITWMTSKYQIHGLPVEEFPMLPEVRDDVTIVVEKGILRRAVERSAFAVSPDESRAALTGILLLLEDDNLKLVATDTHRLSVADCAVVESKGEKASIVPGRTMDELLRIVDDEDGTVTIHVSDSQILFSVDDKALVSRLIEGQFPNYQRVVPQSSEKRMLVPTEQLMQSVRRAAIVAREDANRIIMRSSGGRLVVTAENSKIGTAHEEVDIVLEGDDIEMAFSSSYLLQFLNVIDTDSVEMLLTGNLNPALLKPLGSEDFNHVLMPMQIQ